MGCIEGYWRKYTEKEKKREFIFCAYKNPGVPLERRPDCCRRLPAGMERSFLVSPLVCVGSEIVAESLYQVRAGLFLGHAVKIVYSRGERGEGDVVVEVDGDAFLVVLQSSHDLVSDLFELKQVLEAGVLEKRLGEEIQYVRPDDTPTLPDSGYLGQIHLPDLFP